jgi:hypothetical protein
MSVAAWSPLGILLGVVAPTLFAVAWGRGEFDAEAPKYEMLGMEPPAPQPPVPGDKRLGVTDRVVRLGLLGAVFHYAGAAGWTSAAGLVLVAGGGSLAATGVFGRDPLVGWLRRIREQRSQSNPQA